MLEYDRKDISEEIKENINKKRDIKSMIFVIIGTF